MVSDYKNKRHWWKCFQSVPTAATLPLWPEEAPARGEPKQPLSDFSPDEKKREEKTVLVTDSLSSRVCVFNYSQACALPGAGPKKRSTLLCLPEFCSTNIPHKLQELQFWMIQ